MRALFIAALLLAAGSAHADELLRLPAARQGYFLGGGLRTGVTAADNENVGGFGSLTHVGGLFRFGQMTYDWLGFGLAIGGGTEGNDDWTVGYGGLLLEAQWVPFDIDLALRVSAGVGGGGVSRVRVEDERANDPSFMFGSMYALGLSWDWFPFHDRQKPNSGGFAVTFFAEGRYFPGGDVTLGGGFVGIETTWWSGLPKKKLLLPVEEAY